MPSGPASSRTAQPIPAISRFPAHQKRLSLADLLCITSVIAVMFVFGYVHGHNRIFWSDELMGWLVLREKSFPAMIRNWQAGVDSGSLFYVVCGRWWMEIFGPSETSLRMFSLSGVAASFVILWACARRFYTWQIVALCLPFVYFANITLNWQYFNGRMYGGFMAATALTAFAFLKADPKQPQPRHLLLLTFFAHASLMSSHILGPFYSGMFIAGLIAQDLWARTFRPMLYVSAFASWIILIVSFKNILGTIGAGQQKYWTVTPHLPDLLMSLTVFGHRLGAVSLILLLLATVGAGVRHFRGTPTPTQATPEKTPLYFLLGIFLAVLLVAYVVSRVTTSIFFNRYLLPIVMADALVMCELEFRINRDLLRGVPWRLAGAAIAVMLIASNFVRQSDAYQYPETDYTAELIAKDPGGLPIVITNVQIFAETEFYRDKQVTLVIPEGWPQGSTGAHEMEHWKTAGYYANHILPTDDILNEFPSFLLVDDPTIPWLPDHLSRNAGYSFTSLGQFHKQDFWLVRRSQTSAH